MRAVHLWGVEPGYIDAYGHPQTTDPCIAAYIESALERSGTPFNVSDVVVIRGHGGKSISLPGVAGAWELRDAEGHLMTHGLGGTIELPHTTEIGVYDLTFDGADAIKQKTLILVAPATAYQPPFFRESRKAWLLTAQLYAVRSAHNWGHGDFTDLAQLIRIAADVGAAGVGINPVHALAPGQASPYSPSSRSFLNPLYIDIEAIPEFSGTNLSDLEPDIARLRTAEFIDYVAINSTKRRAFAALYATFCRIGSNQRHQRLLEFRTQQGVSLATFAAFEAAREQRDNSTHGMIDRIDQEQTIAFHSFVQWIAHEQLELCAQLAEQLQLPIGLYLDVAVGADADGADVCSAPGAYAQNLLIGAPPDVYNPQGQNWGLVAFHPQTLIDSNFDRFRQTLRSAMRYAGAIRLDHALGLYRLFLIPADSNAAMGGYVRFPFEALLAVIAQESVDAECLVIGEDLGTIPEGICDALQSWGFWSYRVGLFERDGPERYRSASEYPANAIVTFNTHDLPTFSGWLSSHDLAARKQLGLASFESDRDREGARAAMLMTLSDHGLPAKLSLPNVLRYLARTPTKLLAVSTEDILGLGEQPNMPGTVEQHPNWRRRLPVDIAEFAASHALWAVSATLAAEGRSTRSRPFDHAENSETGAV